MYIFVFYQKNVEPRILRNFLRTQQGCVPKKVRTQLAGYCIVIIRDLQDWSKHNEILWIVN